MTTPEPEALDDLVARVAPDRYLAALFAPSERRAALMALYAFDSEVGRIGEAVREPMVGHIRLGWWREQLGAIYDGGTVVAPVAKALAEAVKAHGLPRVAFEAYLDARAHDFEEAPFEDERALQRYADAVSGGIMRLGLCVLEVKGGEEAARAAGIAVEYARVVSALAEDGRRRRCKLPLDWLERAGLSAEDVFAGASSQALRGVAARVAASADALLSDLGRSRSFPAHAAPVLSAAANARVILRRAMGASFDPSKGAQALPAWQRLARIALANLTRRV
jgi:phytoene/squalene synthetase